MRWFFDRHTALHAVGAGVPACCRLTRRFAAEARWAYRASRHHANRAARFPPTARGHDAAAQSHCPAQGHCM